MESRMIEIGSLLDLWSPRRGMPHCKHSQMVTQAIT